MLSNLCSLTQVELGYQKSDAQNAQFIPATTRQNKRPLRRSEFIAASAWSDTLSNTIIGTRESGALSDGGCVQQNSGNSSSTNFSIGTLQTNNQAYFGSRPPLLSGSSSDPDNAGAPTNLNNSRLCMSRYGVQDLIGNVSEFNSENIFCDYSGVSLYIGEVNPGDPNLASRAKNYGGQIGHRVRINGANQAFLLELGSTRFSIFMNGQWKTHGLADPNTGETVTFGAFTTGVIQEQGFCSTVRSNRNTPLSEVSDEGVWNDIYRPNNSINTSVVSVLPRDIKSLYTLRNGDGKFAEFSEESPLFSLSLNNSFSLNGIFRNFNTLLGLPVDCNNNKCGSAIDNNKVLSRGIASDLGNKHLSEVDDHYFGSSLISSVGTAEVDSNSIIPTGFSKNAENFLTSIRTGAVVSPSGNLISFQETAISALDEGEGTIIRPQWQVGRNNILGMVSGGSSLNTAAQTGRYSLSITDLTYPETNSYVGGRCAVMVNMD
jgi:hypothetical protein